MSDRHATDLTLILGPANSGKLGRVLVWWQERLALQPLIVVPTAPDARSLSAEMAQRQGALVGQSPATTFDGLLRLLLKRSPRYAGDFERSLLVSYLLCEEPPRAPGFSARFPGTAGVVASLLQQLGDSGRSPEEISRLLARWASTDARSAALAVDIARLLAGYSALCDRLGLSNRSDAVSEALAATGGWTRPLALYGFTSFTFAQQRLLAALAKATEILLVLDYERAKGRGLTTPAELAFWEELAGPRVEELPSKSDYMSPAVAFLERHFMDDEPPEDRPPPGPAGHEGGGVRFLLASGQRNEAELAVQEVAGLIRDGLDPGEIGVIVRNTKTWGRLLRDVFASCGIPCEVDQRETLGETGLGRAFLSGLRGVVADDTTPDRGLSARAVQCAHSRAGRRCGVGRSARHRARSAGPHTVCERVGARTDPRSGESGGQARRWRLHRPRRGSGAEPAHARALSHRARGGRRRPGARGSGQRRVGFRRPLRRTGTNRGSAGTGLLPR